LGRLHAQHGPAGPFPFGNNNKAQRPVRKFMSLVKVEKDEDDDDMIPKPEPEREAHSKALAASIWVGFTRSMVPQVHFHLALSIVDENAKGNCFFVADNNNKAQRPVRKFMSLVKVEKDEDASIWVGFTRSMVPQVHFHLALSIETSPFCCVGSL
jgi:hypothetical protein